MEKQDRLVYFALPRKVWENFVESTNASNEGNDNICIACTEGVWKKFIERITQMLETNEFGKVLNEPGKVLN